MNKTTEALKMAIEALETLAMPKGESVYKSAINACKEALESQEQDPVAYMLIDDGVCQQIEYDPDPEAYEYWVKDGYTPLYTYPAQPLSDDEIYSIWKNLAVCPDDIHEFARAIEQAHGIGVKYED